MSISFAEYVLSAVFSLIAIRQLRGQRLAGIRLCFPRLAVAVVSVNYLHGIPTRGNDLMVVAGGALVG
ncbi:MAG: hypothetical protein ACRENX_11875 [Candidatus Dormibacteria bacterium]